MTLHVLHCVSMAAPCIRQPIRNGSSRTSRKPSADGTLTRRSERSRKQDTLSMSRHESLAASSTKSTPGVRARRKKSGCVMGGLKNTAPHASSCRYLVAQAPDSRYSRYRYWHHSCRHVKCAR